MSAAKGELPGKISREDYYRWYDSQPSGRFERVDGQVVAMGAERVAHVKAKSAVFLALRRAVAASGISCEALADGVTVQTGDSDYEPDALVNCGPPIGGDEVAAPNPVVIVEVLSPGTAGVDTDSKLAGYFRVPSVAHYLIVHPTKPLVVHHRRAADAVDTRILAGGEVAMDPPGITVRVEEFYRPG